MSKTKKKNLEENEIKGLARIGSLAELTGINPQTIRRYDAQGILSGYRDQSSGYRYYDLLKICSLIRTRIYRSYEFTLDEVSELFMRLSVSTQCLVQ